MAVIMADAIMSARCKPGRRISYSRRKGWWQHTERYRDRVFTYDTVVPAIDALLAAGLLIGHDLQPAGRPTGIQSSYLPSPRLAEVGVLKVESTPGELIRLKDRNGVLMGYRDTERTHRDRKFIERVNASLRDTEIVLDGVSLDDGMIKFANHTVNTMRASLYRVYNGAWTLGGRFYGGWWQIVSKQDRRKFRLNGQTTVELDYHQQHPRLLYAAAGQSLDDDAYTLDGWDRQLCKRAFNILLNAATSDKAHGALVPYVGGSRSEARDLIAALKTKHQPVSNYFHTGIGLSLQNVDAEVCRVVLAEMIKRRVPTLPIHDSFIVPVEFHDELTEVMESAFAQAATTVAAKIS
ncbi:hypothetical protein [Rhizobium sp. RAF56]|uniref:hypothetical protein n=1 Tax=Rhizobium sp. RAF56 TaxID=3233062 RepID=UPI003F9A7BBC